MARIRAVGRIAAALLAGSLAAGNAAAEPYLFDSRVVIAWDPWAISNTGVVASVHGSDPASFEIDASVLGGAITRSPMSPNTTGGTTFTRTYLSFANEAGSFAAGAGPGAAAFTPFPSLPGFRASSSGGARQFGGTQRLLGHLLRKRTDRTPLFQTILDLPLTPIGGSVGETRTVIHGGTAGFTRTTIWGFPWTTGAVTAMGTTTFGGPISAAAQGSDQRTPGGVGTLQLVTPFLVERDPIFSNGTRVASIATLTLRFIPEPGANLLLVCGIAGLVLLARLGRRGGGDEGAAGGQSCLLGKVEGSAFQGPRSSTRRSSTTRRSGR